MNLKIKKEAEALKKVQNVFFFQRGICASEEKSFLHIKDAVQFKH